MEIAVLKVNGMTCMGCVGSVTRVLQAIKGVAMVDVSLEGAQARVEYDPGAANVGQLKAAIEDAGFEAG